MKIVKGSYALDLPDEVVMEALSEKDTKYREMLLCMVKGLIDLEKGKQGIIIPSDKTHDGAAVHSVSFLGEEGDLVKHKDELQGESATSILALYYLPYQLRMFQKRCASEDPFKRRDAKYYCNFLDFEEGHVLVTTHDDRMCSYSLENFNAIYRRFDCSGVRGSLVLKDFIAGV
tara:strand:+ start:119 stop:640 length:522 start_codon:yes stop_codon:yes gene_type:complete